jgi:Bacterial Ig-like domain
MTHSVPAATRWAVAVRPAKLLDHVVAAAPSTTTVFTTGDNAYESGTDSEFTNCYDPNWGRHKAITRPTVGNHEYYTLANASGYFDYFGARAGDPAKGYYSYDLGQWHVVALNSMCEKVGGCDATSPMVEWLEQDLAANRTTCTLAYFHHPLFSSGSLSGGTSKMKPSWEALYAARADVVLNDADIDPLTATLDPTDSLQGGVAYKAVVTTGAKDVAGNSLDQSPTVGLQQKAWSFTTSN